VDRTFGPGIARIFMRPYNFKVWAHPLEMLDVGWVGERVAVPDPTRVARNVELQRDDVGWGPNNRFRFPRHGGTGAIWSALAGRLPAERVKTGCSAVEIDTAGRSVRFADGSSVRYGAMISTIPLDELARLSRRSEWMELTGGLRHSSVHVIGVGLKGKAPAALGGKCWMYFPEPQFPFYRVTHFSHYSPHNVPDIRNQWSLMAEVSESPYKKVDRSTLAEETIRGLIAAGLVENAEQVSHHWTHRAEHAYPTPAVGRDAVLYKMLPQLEQEGILSRGRFGAWRYEVGNMDHSFMQGVEAVTHLLTGAAELTVWEPQLVNQSHPALGWDRFR
jgi:protoporphyrinogen oxidase